MASIDLSCVFTEAEFAEFSRELTRATCSNPEVYVEMAIAGMTRGSPRADDAAESTAFIEEMFRIWRLAEMLRV